MQTKYRYIEFYEYGEKKQRRLVWYCRNHRSKELLGECFYNTKWREYVFEPDDMTEFCACCLRDIAHFLEQLNQQTEKERGK